MDYLQIVSEVIEEHKKSPVDMLGAGLNEVEYTYLKILHKSYNRTIRDINAFVPKGANILEIGSFLGVVSVSLKRCGYNISAMDIPEFYRSESLRNLYERNNIPFTGLNLRKNSLPYTSGSFDAVIICEVIEHLNFNPLPMLKEINRVLKNNGHIYIGMPNQASLDNRLKLIKGISIHNPIEDYFKQLDKKHNMIVGLHWREYTMYETIDMLKRMGFETVQKYYFRGERMPKSLPNRLIKSTLFKLFPDLLPYQTVIAKKISEPVYDFWLTDANT